MAGPGPGARSGHAALAGRGTPVGGCDQPERLGVPGSRRRVTESGSESKGLRIDSATVLTRKSIVRTRHAVGPGLAGRDAAKPQHCPCPESLGPGLGLGVARLELDSESPEAFQVSATSLAEAVPWLAVTG